MSENINLVRRRRAQLQGAVGDLGKLVIDALNQSVDCLTRHDLDLAERIIEADARINQQRRILEQECLVTLAAYKPAGVDLRAIGACMELVSELERIGDYAVNIMEKAEELQEKEASFSENATKELQLLENAPVTGIEFHAIIHFNLPAILKDKFTSLFS